MASPNLTVFREWLNGKLRELNTDETVFGTYIMGILQAEEDTPEEKTEALNDILSEIIFFSSPLKEKDLTEIVEEILTKWNENTPGVEESGKANASAVNVDEQLAKLMETQKLQSVVKEREYTEEEKRIKESILAQYSQSEVTDEEGEESEDETSGKAGGGGGSSAVIERNTNALDVLQLQKEKREQARIDSAAKKQKDKDDREKQKQMREEKKEKRKTVKGERRR